MEGIKVLAWWGSSSIFSQSQRAANARRSILHFLQSSKGNELFNSTLESQEKRQFFFLALGRRKDNRRR
jgi:hypothetical protein